MSDLPAGWESARLGELGAEVRGSVKPDPGITYELYSVPTYPTGSPELVRGEEIGSIKRLVEPGDVLLCKINPRINRVWMVAEPSGVGPQIASTEYLVFRTPNLQLSAYLRWYFHSPSFRRWIEFSVEGATGSHTRAKSGPTLEQVIPVPPMGEQTRIVSAVEEHLSRLNAAEAAVRSAQLRLRVLSYAFGTRAQAEGDEVALDDLLLDIEAGRSFKTPGRRADPDEWGVIKVSAMTWGEFNERENKAIPIDRPVDARYEIRPGDLLLSRANTSDYVGATVLVGACRSRLVLSDKSMRLLTRDGVDRRWLRFALGSPQVRAQLSRLATGTSDSMRNISQAKVRAVRIRVPSPARQATLADELDEALRARKRLDAGLRAARIRSATLRRSILAAAFSGQLVPGDSSDEPASVLLERIREQRAAATPTTRARARAVRR